MTQTMTYQRALASSAARLATWIDQLLASGQLEQARDKNGALTGRSQGAPLLTPESELALCHALHLMPDWVARAQRADTTLSARVWLNISEALTPNLPATLEDAAARVVRPR